MPSGTVEPIISIQAEDFDAAEVAARLTGGRHDIGAVVTFTGLCRDEGGALAALELEHYPQMAEKQLRAIADEAVTRWPVDGLAVIHRYGAIPPGGNIVLVAAASRHREAAFRAAEFLMDFLKTQAPFWKREHRADGEKGDWVAARDADDDAAARWEMSGDDRE